MYTSGLYENVFTHGHVFSLLAAGQLQFNHAAPKLMAKLSLTSCVKIFSSDFHVHSPIP